MKKILVASLLFLGIGVASPLGAKSGSWEYVGTHDNVKVSRQQIEGTSVMAFKGETVANVHISRIIAVFIDEDERKHWVDRYDGHKTLASSARSATYWIKFNLPFPVSNRDYVLKTDVEIDEANKIVEAHLKSVKDPRKPDDDCCVRAITTRGYYKFQALPGGKTKMLVEIHTDPKGMLPNWLVNSIQKDWPSKTLGSLIKRSKVANKVQEDLKAWFPEEA